jgi:galactokinase
VGELFVPGRPCSFGEHSDWAAGYRRLRPELSPGFCLVAGTDQGLRGEAELGDAFEITSVLASGEEIGPARVEARPAALAEAARGADFFSYAVGVAAEVMERHGPGGLRLRVAGDLPVRKGLSSSAAICVLVARAFASVYGLALSVREEMELAYAGERRTGSECGRMDQVCAYGRRVTWLRFDDDDFTVEPLAPAAPLHLLIVDLRRGKGTRRILAGLNACFPDTPGALMSEAQALFDEKVAPASPAELAGKRLHGVLAHPALRALAWGGKGVGSQGDGCAQLVARGPAERERLAALLERDLDVRCWPLTVPPPR